MRTSSRARHRGAGAAARPASRRTRGRPRRRCGSRCRPRASGRQLNTISNIANFGDFLAGSFSAVSKTCRSRKMLQNVYLVFYLQKSSVIHRRSNLSKFRGTYHTLNRNLSLPRANPHLAEGVVCHRRPLVEGDVPVPLQDLTPPKMQRSPRKCFLRIFAKSWRVGSRLYRSRFLRVNIY